MHPHQLLGLNYPLVNSSFEGKLICFCPLDENNLPLEQRRVCLMIVTASDSHPIPWSSKLIDHLYPNEIRDLCAEGIANSRRTKEIKGQGILAEQFAQAILEQTNDEGLRGVVEFINIQ
jgi:hypothetical protein